MNFDELQAVWKAYDRKLQTTQELNERILRSMIAERSGNRFSKVRRNYILGIAWMALWLAFSALVMIGNPFDYRYAIQYVPIVIFGTGLIILMTELLRSLLTFQKIAITHYNVGEALTRIIAVYERPKRFFKYTIVVFLFSQVVLFPLSFLPRNIDTMGLGPAMAERLIPISITALLIFLAYKLGAFKERHVDKFREDLNELQTLRAMSDELINEN